MQLSVGQLGKLIQLMRKEGCEEMVFAGWLYGAFGVNGYFGMAAMAALGIGAGLMVGRNWHGGMLDLSR